MARRGSAAARVPAVEQRALERQDRAAGHQHAGDPTTTWIVSEVMPKAATAPASAISAT
jgi:hypothetical protein